MDLTNILTIAGKNGLYKVVTQSKNSIIVESLADGKKLPVFATDRSSSLEDISIFTREEDLPLREVLLKIHEKEDGKPSIDPKSDPAELAAHFESILPEYDKDRVYHSDIKKVFTWYGILLEKGLITKPSDEEKEKDAASLGEDTPGHPPTGKTPGKAKSKAGADKVNIPQIEGKHSKMEGPKRRTMQKK
jgi:hypothetical protein